MTGSSEDKYLGGVLWGTVPRATRADTGTDHHTPLEDPVTHRLRADIRESEGELGELDGEQLSW